MINVCFLLFGHPCQVEVSVTDESSKSKKVNPTGFLAAPAQAASYRFEWLSQKPSGYGLMHSMKIFIFISILCNNVLIEWCHSCLQRVFLISFEDNTICYFFEDVILTIQSHTLMASSVMLIHENCHQDADSSSAN